MWELNNNGGFEFEIVTVERQTIYQRLNGQHEDVAECVSFGVDDEDYGQDVGCAINLKDRKEQMDTQAREKWIGERVTAHKVPKKVSAIANISLFSRPRSLS